MKLSPTSWSLAPLFIPIGFLSLFLFGEVLGGDMSGMSHAVQIIPLIVIALASKKYPRVAGWAAIILSIAFSIWYISWAEFDPITYALLGGILVLPVTISGIVLLRNNPNGASS